MLHYCDSKYTSDLIRMQIGRRTNVKLQTQSHDKMIFMLIKSNCKTFGRFAINQGGRGCGDGRAAK